MAVLLILDQGERKEKTLFGDFQKILENENFEMKTQNKSFFNIIWEL